MRDDKLSMLARAAILRIWRHQTDEFGVIIDTRIAETIMKRGYAKEAARRRYAREGGVCLRLTDKGEQWVAA